MLFFFLGCNDNPTAQQFMAAYRKLLLHNEVVSMESANCLNDITKTLYVSSGAKNKSKFPNQAELELLSNFDFENQIDYYEDVGKEVNSLKQHSMAYMASLVENAVLRKMINKVGNCCSACLNVFLENEITDDSFIEYKEQISNILPPCNSTIRLMETVDMLLNNYSSQNASLTSTLTHIMRKIDISKFYDKSSFDDHDHKYDLIKLVMKTYMNIKSTEACKSITKLAQGTPIRHTNLKEVHRAGQ